MPDESAVPLETIQGSALALGPPFPFVAAAASHEWLDLSTQATKTSDMLQLIADKQALACHTSLSYDTRSPCINTMSSDLLLIYKCPGIKR
eukprot:m.33442 g.33442  ORF g.33442 m.33442 type:complete len:91 (+) comp12236_c0_seq3:281-553(+)